MRATAATKRQVLQLVADVAARRTGQAAAGVLDALLCRERTGSTGVGGGVAAPHARLAGIDRMHGVFLRLDEPVAFDAIDDQPVDLIFALFAPLDADAEHLRALAKVSRVLRRGDLREQLRLARSPDAVRVLLTDEAQPSAA